MPYQKPAAWLARRAEDVVVALLSAMCVVVLVQIVSRYLLNWPIGRTHEVSVILWIWLRLFGSAFVIRDVGEMRFDLIYGAVGDRTRRRMALVTSAVAVAVVVLVLSMPGLRHLHEGGENRLSAAAV
ncbi:TRAP transporter small permease [Falsigemmobacter faecalis]|uniref:TRAP transporter small permease n=1 Tax=Falsigemmobacter faecalis TaxID=2488730 RepID=UPI001F33904C|nr:TRAP transporter small permease subunit [Falsigemmobacter faecalis]